MMDAEQFGIGSASRHSIMNTFLNRIMMHNDTSCSKTHLILALYCCLCLPKPVMLE